jgi:hypothetical protein
MDVKLNINGAEVVVPEQTITEAIGKGELTIQNEEIKVFKKPDFDAYVSNVKKEDYENGKRAGIEMEIKAAREKYGLQFEGKTLDNFAESLTGKLKAEFGKEPDKRVQELTKDLDSLRSINQEWETKYNGLQNTIKQEQTQAKKNNLILSALPKENLSIPADDLAIIFKNRYDVDFDEAGNPLVKKDGQVLKSPTTLSPLSINDVASEFVKPYIKQQINGGRGEGHNTPPGATAMDAFIKEMEGKGFKPGSKAFNDEMSKRIADKTLQYK